jgi:hypothetical protein
MDKLDEDDILVSRWGTLLDNLERGREEIADELISGTGDIVERGRRGVPSMGCVVLVVTELGSTCFDVRLWMTG